MREIIYIIIPLTPFPSASADDASDEPNPRVTAISELLALKSAPLITCMSCDCHVVIT